VFMRLFWLKLHGFVVSWLSSQQLQNRRIELWDCRFYTKNRDLHKKSWGYRQKWRLDQAVVEDEKFLDKPFARTLLLWVNGVLQLIPVEQEVVLNL
jgi:hypothetical protein